MNKLYILLFGLTFCVGHFYGQEQEDDLKTEVFEGEANNIQVIRKSNKLSISPQIFDTVIKVPEIRYSMIPKQYYVEHQTDTVKPVKLKIVEPINELYRLYTKLGFGMYLTPLAQIEYSSLRSKTSQYGFSYNHLSSWQNVSNEAPESKFMDNALSLWGKRMWTYYRVDGGLDYQNNHYNFYGYEKSIESGDERFMFPKYNQVNKLGAHGYFSSFYPDSTRVNFGAGLQYQFLTSNTESFSTIDTSAYNRINEHYIKAKFNVYRLYKGVEYLNDLLLNVDGYIDYNYFDNRKDNLSLVEELSINGYLNNNAIISLEPTAKFYGEKWKVKAGLGIAYSMANENDFYAYPLIEMDYSFFDDLFIPYVGIKGGVNRNTYSSLLDRNQYINPYSAYVNTFNKYNIYGGFRGSISKTVSFNLGVNHQLHKNYALFIQDMSIDTTGGFIPAGNVYKPFFDELMITEFKGEISYQQNERFKVNAQGSYFLYETQLAAEAYYLPDYEVKLNALYNLQNKFIFDLGINLIGSRYALSYHLNPSNSLLDNKDVYYDVDGGYLVLENLKPYVDLNLGVEYRYTKRLSFFLDLNNIANVQYQNFDRYYVQGIQVLGGLTLSLGK